MCMNYEVHANTKEPRIKMLIIQSESTNTYIHITHISTQIEERDCDERMQAN